MNGRKSNKVQITVKRYSAYIWGIIIVMCLTGCQNTKGERETGQSEMIESREKMYDNARDEAADPVINDGANLEKRKNEIVKELVNKKYPDVPEPFDDVIRQYEQIILVTEGLTWEEAWLEFENDDWKYVYDPLYGAGRYDNIYYSFYDLTGDEFPEMIMGKKFEGQFYPYLIYYYDGDKVWMECECERYSLAFYEDDIVEVVGPTNIMYLQFKTDTETWERVEYLEIQYEGAGILDYIREDMNNDSKESVYENISEEEYQQIIEQYRTTPIELEWMVLWEVVG